MKHFVALALLGGILGVGAGWVGFHYPTSALEIVDLSAAVAAILVGTSLAVGAILATPISGEQDEVPRVKRIIVKSDLGVLGQQMAFLSCYMISLLAGISLKLTAEIDADSLALLWCKVLASLFMASLAFSLVLSISLPFTMRALIAARRCS